MPKMASSPTTQHQASRTKPQSTLNLVQHPHLRSLKGRALEVRAGSVRHLEQDPSVQQPESATDRRRPLPSQVLRPPTSLPHKTLSCSAFASPAAFLLRINYADLHNSPKTTAVAAPISRRGAISSSASFSPATSSASSSASSPSASPLAAPAPTTSAISLPRLSPASTPANSST